MASLLCNRYADKLIFRLHLVNAFIPLIVCQTYRFVDLGQLAEVVKVGVHLLVADNRQHLVVLLELNVTPKITPTFSDSQIYSKNFYFNKTYR